MNRNYRNYRKVPTRFGPETRFEVTPVPLAPFRVAQEARFEQLRSQLLSEELEELTDSELNSQLRRAANEATSLALVTAYPLLVFPGIFEEKVRNLLRLSEENGSRADQRNSVLLAV